MRGINLPVRIFDGGDFLRTRLPLIQALKYSFRRKYIKCFHWEYWPMWMVYFPVSFYYLWLSIKARSFFFFSAANPNIETGGMFFESKWDIFKLIPQEYYPATTIVRACDDIVTALSEMDKLGLTFPVIAKPDRGERGWCVEILKNRDALQKYMSTRPVDFLLQDLSICLLR